MFGYVRADMSRLSEAETDAYRTVYCTLCKALKKHYGFTSSFFLNYDLTFLALLKLNSAGDDSVCTNKFCAYKCKKCKVINNREEIFFFCASLLIILCYEKALDNLRDEKLFKKFGAWLLKIFLRKKYIKASRAYPALSRAVSENMTYQISAERENASLDKAAHASADTLGQIFSEGERQREQYYRFGYNLGRWIYFIDAADDRQKDKKSGSFNPLLEKYDDKKIEQLLNLNIGEASFWYKKIPVGEYTSVINNILYAGTFVVQNSVLRGEKLGSVRSFRHTKKRR